MGGSAAIFAGRDLRGGGTWLGLRRSGNDRLVRIGALTNLRPGLMPPPPAPAPDVVPPSRGRLVVDYLAADSEPAAYLQSLDPPADAYAGFNLLAMQVAATDDRVTACYLNNLPGSRPRRLASGVHAISNATLDVEWPKTRRLRDAMTRALDAQPARSSSTAGGADDLAAAAAAGDAEALEAFLLEALADRITASEDLLPRTGLEPPRERLLSSPFIVDDHYGTRCSTVIGISRSGAVFFTERRFGPRGQPLGLQRERFLLVGSDSVRP
jgi:uncharacterized protein with NRDE domain